MDKTTAIVVGTMSVVLMLVLGALGVAVVIDDDNSAPAPTMTSAPAPTPSATPTSGGDGFILEILEETWNEQSYKDQQSLCMLFDYQPEQAWNAFDGGSEHLVPKDVFMTFFGGKCASIT